MKGTTAFLAVAVLVLAFRAAEAIPPPWTIEELKAKADLILIAKTTKAQAVANAPGANRKIGIVPVQILKGKLGEEGKDAKLFLLFSKPVERVGPGGIRMHVMGGVGHPKPRDGETALVFLRKGREPGCYSVAGGSFGYLSLTAKTKEDRAALEKRIDRYLQWGERIRDAQVRDALAAVYQKTLAHMRRAAPRKGKATTLPGTGAPEP